MSAGVTLQPRIQRESWPSWCDLESCPRSVADSWRPLFWRTHETDSDTRRLVLLPRIPCPQPPARDLWRSPRSAGHARPAKNAICSGCGTRHRALRPHDAPSAGYRRRRLALYVVFEQRRVACALPGRKVERLDIWPESRYTPVRSPCRHLVSGHVNKAVAQLLHLHEHTVRIWMQYMRPGWPRRRRQPRE